MRYLTVTYSIAFEDRPEWRKAPAFVFRSVIGLALRRLTCALRLQESCHDCMVRESCVYSVFFETNVDKANTSLPGRNRAVHPFVVDIRSLTESSAVLDITFIGRAVNYIPYLNIALTNAGEVGIGRNRAKFSVTGIYTGEDEFVPNLREIERRCSVWPSENVRVPKTITLVTPCRIKEKGKYISSVTLDSLTLNMLRRVTALSELFGDEKDRERYLSISPVSSTPQNQKWTEKTYYSSRQKSRMQFGGVVGEILVNGIVPPDVCSLVEAMELFHVGKNISFGLGKIKVEYR